MKNLEKYKKEIANRIRIRGAFSGLAIIAVLVGNFYLKEKFPLQENATDFMLGFFTGLQIINLYYMGSLIRAYRNEAALHEMYTKEADEREILIRMKSGDTIIPIFSMLIAIVSLVVFYISYEVFIALIIVAFAQIIASKTLKIYWSKKI